MVNTDKGNSYLIHSTPSSGAVVTKANEMSNKWTKTRDIKVEGNKTVGDIFKASSGRSLNKMVNYATGGTCKGVAQRAENALKK